jgi:hypothetical protein
VWEGDIEIVILAGEAVPPTLEIEPAILDFADQGIGIASQPLIVTATNIGQLPMSIQAAFSSGGDDFTVAGVAGFPDGAIPSPAPTSTSSSTASETPSVSAPSAPAPSASPAPGPTPSLIASPTASPTAGPSASPTGQAGAGDCAVLEPGASCELEVTFNPSALGDRTGSLVVVGTVGDLPLQEGVEASGGALEPEVEFSPAVIREGQVTFAVGSHFLPGVPVQLSWSFGPVALPVIIPDDTGAFRAPIVVMRDGGPGHRTLTVTMPGIGSFPTEPLLVVPGSAQPPDFTTRN